MKAISNKEKAEKAEQRLSDWLRETPLEFVPKNQFRRVSRQKVCKLLGISPSTVGSNDRIRGLFDALDERLEVSSRPANRAADESTAKQANEVRSVSFAELDLLRQKLARLSYLEEYAIWVPA